MLFYCASQQINRSEVEIQDRCCECVNSGCHSLTVTRRSWTTSAVLYHPASTSLCLFSVYVCIWTTFTSPAGTNGNIVKIRSSCSSCGGIGRCKASALPCYTYLVCGTGYLVTHLFSTTTTMFPFGRFRGYGNAKRESLVTHVYTAIFAGTVSHGLAYCSKV